MRILSILLLLGCSETGTLTVVDPAGDATVVPDEPGDDLSDDPVGNPGDPPDEPGNEPPEDPTDSDDPVDPPDDSDVPPVITPDDDDGDGVINADDCAPDDPDAYPGAPELCNDRDDNCDGDVDEQNTCPCPTSSHAGGHYMVCPAFVSWTEARNACERAGMHLVIIDDAAENTFVRNADLGPLDIIGISWWIGLSDIGDEGNFSWVDGSPVSYDAWRPDEPNNGGFRGEDCAEFETFPPAGWNDVRCADGHPFICEAW